MRNFALIAGLLMGLALSTLAPSVAQAEGRPGSDTVLFTLLNGKISRDMNTNAGGGADGGGLTLWSTDAGPGCNNVATGAVYEMHCTAAGHFCPWGTDGGTAGSFCTTAIQSVSYGKPVNASTPSAPFPFYFVTGPGAAGTVENVCWTPIAGAALGSSCALFRLR